MIAPAGSAGSPLIAVFTKNRENPAYAAARLGADRVAARYGARTMHYVPSLPDHAGQQQALVDEAIAARPVAVLFVATDAEAMVPSIRKFNTAGIPLFAFINRPLGGDYLSFVGSDDRALAVRIATRLFTHLGRQGRVLVLAGTPGSVSGRDRLAGFAEAFAAHPAVIRVADVAGAFLRDVACREMAAIITTGVATDVAFDAILAANDAMALGAIAALAAAGRPLPPVVGVNAVPEAIAAIRAGTLLATASFDAMKMAALACEAALRHLRGERVPHDILLPVDIVDRGNCATWEAPFETRALPDWDSILRPPA